MKRCILFSILFVLAVIPDAFAQVVDVRAFSRQRGFKAYQVKQTKQVPRRKVIVEKTPVSPKSDAKDNETTQETTQDEQPQNDNWSRRNQTKEIQDYIAKNPHVLPDIGI